MIEIKEDTLTVGMEMDAQEIGELKTVLLENGDALKKIVVEGETERLGSTMLLQLLAAFKKSYPQIVVEPFDSGETETLKWGYWSWE